jgi:subtilisin family serine protease
MKLLMPPLLLLLAPYAIEAGHATPVKFEADSDSALSDSAPAPPPRRFIVGYKNRQGKYRAQSAAQKKSRTSSGPQSFSAQGAATTDGHDADLGQQNAVAVTLSSEASERLKEDPNIEYVEEDSIRYPTMMRGYHQHLKDDVLKENIPNNNNETRRDENYRKLTETVPYGIPMVQADQVPYDSTNPRTICIIDTGYNLGHEYLPSTNVVGIDGNLAWNEDGNGHGTHVAGR